MEEVYACVVGAGVIGLAIARELVSLNSDVLILDQEPDFGQGISSRNSEVIHAGIYYPKDSIKAQMCVRGNQLLYEYCQSHKVAANRCGKLIVATSEEEEGLLSDIHAKGVANQVNGLEFLSPELIKKEEPQVKAQLAILSPTTGIISAHELMSAMLGDVEAGGGNFVGQSCVKEITPTDNGFRVRMRVQDKDDYEIQSQIVINAAGLGAQTLAHSIEGLSPDKIPPLYYCKGNYFSMSGKSPFNHLIYPVPDPSGAGLGVHATLDMGGQVRFGPDVEYVETEDYAVNENRLSDYYNAIRRYYPGLGDGALSPAYVGIRPKLTPQGGKPQDFVIQGPDDHGIQGLIQLYGIESPGLTSSLAIAEHVKPLVT